MAPGAKLGRVPSTPKRREPARTADDAEALNVLKIGGALGLVFLLAYAIVDLTGAQRGAAAETEHWALLGATCLFFGMTWTPLFRRYWKFWALVYCVFVMVMFVMISARTGDPESRFITMLLCPLATASFVSWGWRWQLAMNAAALAIYAAAERLVPVASQLNTFRWMGLLAALAFAQATAIFVERYRLRIRGQLEALEAAARFREAQIATMVHDIRSPVAAVAGFAQLLEESSADPEQRRQLIARIGSATWNMNLVVSNVLDLYRIEEDGRFHPVLTQVDPAKVIAAAAEDCAGEALRRGRELELQIAPMPMATLDGHHLDRIVRNLVAATIARADGRIVSLRAAVRGATLELELNAHCAPIAPADLASMLAGPDGSGRGGGALGLFIARLMAESAGGSVKAGYDSETGITLRSEIPIAGADSDGTAARPDAP